MKHAAVAVALTLAASAVASAGVPVIVDGKPLGEAVVVEGTPYFDVAVLTGPAGMTQARGWRVEGGVLAARDPGAGSAGLVQVQKGGIVSRKVRTLEGRTLVPVDDVAHALGGHVHAGAKDGVLRVSTVSRCDYCVLAPKPANKGL